VAHLQVTCITKRPAHNDPHQRIQGLGGRTWHKGEDDVIRDIERGANSYYVSVSPEGTHSSWSPSAAAASYVKTTADDYTPNNLLALPDCRL
jgi:Protein of unknown function (DUF3892)